MIQHVVLVKWKSGTTTAQQEASAETVRGLANKNPGISNFSTGNQCSIEGLGKGFHRAFQMTFKDAKVRNEYLDDPEHKKAVENIFPLLDDIIVLDYEL
jgi:hypothetical protein